MKPRVVCLSVGLLFSSLTLPHPLVAAGNEAKAEVAPSEAKENKKNTTVLVLAAPPDKVHAAALEALAAIGCKVKKDSPNYIEGKRSNKVGLAVGSGGEKLFVEIKDLGDGTSELKVITKKTMAGIIGQKRWNEEVAFHIRDAVK